MAQSALILGGMALLVAICGYILFGPLGLIGVAIAVTAALIFGSRFSSAMVLRMYKAQPLSPRQLPEVFRIIEQLTKRAGLEHTPKLYYVPSAMMNAFAVGQRDEAAIGVTDGLLRALNLRELTGVLAHEMSHIRNNDVWLMGIADLAGRVTRMMSLLGMGLLLFSVPMWLSGGSLVSFVLIMLLIFAPQLTTLLQLALSRSREFDADLDAAGLTGDPLGFEFRPCQIGAPTAVALGAGAVPGTKASRGFHPSQPSSHQGPDCQTVVALRRLRSVNGASSTQHGRPDPATGRADGADHDPTAQPADRLLLLKPLVGCQRHHVPRAHRTGSADRGASWLDGASDQLLAGTRNASAGLFKKLGRGGIGNPKIRIQSEGGSMNGSHPLALQKIAAEILAVFEPIAIGRRLAQSRRHSSDRHRTHPRDDGSANLGPHSKGRPPCHVWL